MLDFSFSTIAITVGAGLITVPLARRLKRKLSARRAALEAELLRQYPEVAEIVADESGASRL